MRRALGMVTLFLVSAVPARAQELHADVGYAHIFRAGGFSFATGYLRGLSAPAAAAQQRVGGNSGTPIPMSRHGPRGMRAAASSGSGRATRSNLRDAVAEIHPVAAVPVRLIHSSIPDQITMLPQTASLLLEPQPPTALPSEDRDGSAWGWGAGVELGVRVVLSPQWNLQTSGTAMYQDVYAGSTTSGAWTWHVGLGYRFGS